MSGMFVAAELPSTFETIDQAIDDSIALLNRVGDASAIVIRSFDTPAIAIPNQFHLATASPPPIHIPGRAAHSL